MLVIDVKIGSNLVIDVFVLCVFDFIDVLFFLCIQYSFGMIFLCECVVFRMCARREAERSEAAWGTRCIDMFSNLEIIGEGTYGLVYKAKDNVLGWL